MERCGNRRQRVEHLISAWNQGVREDGIDDPLIDKEVARQFEAHRDAAWAKKR